MEGSARRGATRGGIAFSAGASAPRDTAGSTALKVRGLFFFTFLKLLCLNCHSINLLSICCFCITPNWYCFVLTICEKKQRSNARLLCLVLYDQCYALYCALAMVPMWEGNASATPDSRARSASFDTTSVRCQTAMAKGTAWMGAANVPRDIPVNFVRQVRFFSLCGTHPIYCFFKHPVL